MTAIWKALPVVALALAWVGPAGAEVTKWRVMNILEGGSSSVCPDVKAYKHRVEFDGGVVRTRASSGAPREFKLTQPLNADGSGRVTALNDKNRPVTLEFEAGSGPRTIRYSPAYSPCVYSWIPAERG
jgi:hypothetical protein